MKKYIICTSAHVAIEIEAANKQEAEDKAMNAPVTEWEVVCFDEESDFYTEEEGGDDD